ncbi:MAG: sulfotransferase [Longimicrobiales bacterium]
MLYIRLLRETLFPGAPTGPGILRRRLLLLLFTPLFLLIQSAHWGFFLLDDLLFPGYRKIRIREPLFVVGLPRSGTTFLHRVLARDASRFTTTRLWELLLAPSITQRKILLGLGALDRALGRPVGRLLAWTDSRGFRWMEAIHQVSLTDPEEDYFLLLPVFACFLLVVPYPYHPAIWELARFDELPEKKREAILGFYRRALQRHLYVTGPEKQILSKNPAFTPFLRSLLESFPDARVLCSVRDPEKAVPSVLSSLRPGAAFLGYEMSEPRIRDAFLDMLVHFSEHAMDVLGGEAEDRYAFVPMAVLKADVRRFVLEEVYGRFGWQADAAFRASLEEDRARGASYTSRHRYSLEEFGLEAGAIRTRFARLSQAFGFGKEAGG